MKYIEAYLNYLKVLRKDSDYTIVNYKNDLLELFDFTNDLLGITPKTIQEYLEYLYSRGLNRNTISRKLSAIRSFYHYLKNENLVGENYFKEISSPRRKESLPKYAKDNDLEKLFLCFNTRHQD